MPGAANDVWWDDLRQEAELPPPPRSRWPMAAGVLAAAAVAGGVGWWLASPSKTYFDNPAVAPAPAQTVRAAAPAADAEQVRRAYEEFRLVYANSGVDGLNRFNESCEASLRADARILDFCLAFDLFSATVGASDAEAAGKAQARRMTMVQTAAPGADPDARLSEVRGLMRDAAGIRTAQAETAAPAASVAAAGSTPAAPAPVQMARAPAPRPEPARTAVAATPAPVRAARTVPPRKAAPAGQACRMKSTPAERLMCANPALRVQERRMKAAYERALAAGADPLAVDAGQAQWRAERNAADSRGELADLYARRTRELNQAAEAAARTPPT
ncbi:hypothetical protein ACO2Q0_17015 [Phenylobacterium sp. VNQ135]|uniref:hypothetical protein n=1 Tax=Phenylobacterium sp. VNQ135 TaxID=3400922 RepID=UPI003C021644